jgi:hypothetical protein
MPNELHDHDDPRGSSRLDRYPRAQAQGIAGAIPPAPSPASPAAPSSFPLRTNSESATPATIGLASRCPRVRSAPRLDSAQSPSGTSAPVSACAAPINKSPTLTRIAQLLARMCARDGTSDIPPSQR